jgi:hypothetical protein
MVRLLFAAFTVLFLSCTILEDTDVTTADELQKLKLTSIEITETLNGITNTQTAKVAEEIINETLPNGAILAKRKTISWPTFTNPKFQFRSGVTKDITLVSEYLYNGKIKFWHVYSSGVEAEKYEFLYDNGVLAFLKTTITANNQKTQVVDHYSLDSYNFPTSRDGASPANFGSDKSLPTPCSFKFVWQFGSCVSTSPSTCEWTEKKQYNYCDADNFYILNKDGTEGGRAQFQVIQNEILEEIYLGETQSSGSCCGDKFYFHPYLFMPGDIRIKIMYAPDWWKDDISFSSATEQNVRIKFNYEL